ncbi:MAG: hypothetical protein IJ724_07860 [Muribaculaceae bacterium]|nr:hypothetical protein [Muribaculaceae bacterium]MBR1726545.1 hypothetical protein [Muribaculaceae bacterium]
MLKSIKRIITPKPDPTEMTYEQFCSMVHKGEVQYRQGKCKTFASVEEFDRYLQSKS